MIQEIAPSVLNNQYAQHTPAADSLICVYSGRDILVREGIDTLALPTWEILRGSVSAPTFLLELDGTALFLAQLTGEIPAGYAFANLRALRIREPMPLVYACMTAWHLNVWYGDNRFCGRCGKPTEHHETMRMLRCPECGNQIFPKICPAVIVGVTNGDRILLTRYAGRAYKNYALVAGFCEIGETAEETVAREVFEETGVRVKNVRYWATQPWGIDCDLLLGYFAELDGDPSITVDDGELSMAGWYRADEIDMQPDNRSLTHDMIRAFIEGRHLLPRRANG